MAVGIGVALALALVAAGAVVLKVRSRARRRRTADPDMVAFFAAHAVTPAQPVVPVRQFRPAQGSAPTRSTVSPLWPQQRDERGRAAS